MYDSDDKYLHIYLSGKLVLKGGGGVMGNTQLTWRDKHYLIVNECQKTNNFPIVGVQKI